MPPSLRSICVISSFAAIFAACAGSEPIGETGTAGTSAVGKGGTTGGGASGGTAGPGEGGTLGAAGTMGEAGTNGSGVAGTTGAGARGGTTSAGGSVGGSGGSGSGGSGSTGVAGTTGVAVRGGTTGAAGTTGVAGRGGTTGGAGTMGVAGRGGTTGAAGTTGVAGRGGTTGSGGGGATGSGGAAVIDCAATIPSGGTQHNSSNQSGTAAGMNWTIWSNGSGGSITTFDVPAFKAAWANSGDFLARLGLQWNATKTYDQLGTVTAQFASKKTGDGGGYSYIGIYGWSVSPCIEFYIVDDSFKTMPVNPGSTTMKGTADIDGGTYILYTRPTTGTGGSKCSGVTSWTQFYSVRRTARTCGQISVSQHFAAWAAAGMTLGKMDQAQLLVEVGGGTGSIDFPVASMTAQ